MTHLALFYGSLKKDHYNFNRFGGQTYLKTVQIPGFRMHSLTHYPGIVPDPNSKIVAELHKVEEVPFSRIRIMEEGAGYKEVKMMVDGVDASLFVYQGRLDQHPLVENGEWK